MADSPRRAKRGSWVRARKARPQPALGRRRRRRLEAGRGGGRKRLRRRVLQARAAGADWREGACEGPRGAEPGPAAAPAPAPAPAPAAAPDPAPAPRTRSRHPCIPVPRALGPDRVLLLLPLEQGYTFSGTCRLTCVLGQVQVLGCTLGRGHARDLFSTYTHVRLTINAVHYPAPERSDKEIRKDVHAALRPYCRLEDRNWVVQKYSPLCSVVLLERVKSTVMNYIASHPGLSTVFVQESHSQVSASTKKTIRELQNIGIKKEKVKSGLEMSESALSALEELVSLSCEEVDGCPIIMVCGQQDIGKSTFNRYLINQLLNSLPCVDYLECDLGQTEFTPPGCISLLNITEPVLGPPYTHQRTPQKMVYFGRTSCHNNYEGYIEAVKYVFATYKREAPLVVNTMGWMTDKGPLLLVDLIRILAPSHVLQFSFESRSKHIPDITASYVDATDGLYTRSTARARSRGSSFLPELPEPELAEDERAGPAMTASHKLIHIRSEFTIRRFGRNRDPFNKVLRDLAVLGYLSLLQPPAPQPLRPLQALTPYQVPFNAVALRVLHSDVAPTHIMYALNASWLGLCRIADEVRGYKDGPVLLAQSPLCDCLGFGICRGVDMEKKLYLILTPVPPEQLRTVNCLLLGAVSIPSCVIKNQSGPEGTIPYTTTDYNYKLPGASEKIGARELEEGVEERLPPRERPRRKKSEQGLL
ncbi:polynucleotide 5'-hydroxyl-kinase NOL9 [Sorex araneus]|uniref:polynucleotide 5'-hydroxyl-kinase NOL9 n=1 Tax=Sorex araneus TaxID=42254 RepID=UPI00243348A5|nr:polynucleotide 5'-hydroxyl-kinase NOL9 [Sorex araneus]